MLHPALGTPARKDTNLGAGPEEDTNMIGEIFLWGKDERVGVAQTGKGKVLVRPCWSLSSWRGLVRRWDQTAEQGLLWQTRGTSITLKEDWFWCDMRKNYFYKEGGKTLAQVAWRSCECPTPGNIQGWTGVWAAWCSWRHPCSLQSGWTGWLLKVSPNPDYSVIYRAEKTKQKKHKGITWTAKKTVPT